MLRVLRMLRPFSIPLAAVIVVVFLQSMGDLYLPTLMSDIVNKGITNSDVDYIMQMGARMLAVVLASSVCAILASYLSAHIAMGLGEALRARIFRKVITYSLHEFDRISTPSLITRSTNDVTQIQNVLVMSLRMVIGAPITAVGGIILAMQKDRGLAWIIAIVLPILTALITVVAVRGFPLFQAIQKKIDRINLVLRENLTGVRVIRAFNREASEQARYNEANRDLTQTAIRVNRMFATLMPSIMLIMNFTTLAILWFGTRRVNVGSSNVGNMMAFLQYAMQILFSFLMASIMFIMIPRAQASANRINEVLDLRSEVEDPDRPVSPGAGQRGMVEFRNVSFQYHGAEEPAVREISFLARPGETTAIIGSTGSGKTTLLSLVPRFYDVTAGAVLVDGVDVRDMSQEELRQRIGYVPQKAVLFTGTVAENIRFGKEDATDQEVAKAAETAQALEFVSAMEQGFDSPISQGGTNVSGGQKQRLAIARALVKQPDIYLFDDSFSALDFKTDARLRAALKRDTADATVIIVGQRVATIMDADRIIVLDDGRIAGMGTHKEL
ncbi:MAG TPA: ABC transporter ATP-binding protein, partial [Spirochaetia bacterium]|nr:ABC transporter ATP-binding protein [Spirochaetia bacterium]